MFGDSSRYYDLIYGFKDYRQEAEFLRNLIERVAAGARTLLDVACGTGEHLRYLTCYHAEGLDRNSNFLEIARRKLPEVRFYLADMRDFKLGKTSDAAPNPPAPHSAISGGRVGCRVHRRRSRRPRPLCCPVTLGAQRI
jgi:SAM-dependent methyltransferase